jgi:hypothetical protein
MCQSELTHQPPNGPSRCTTTAPPQRCSRSGPVVLPEHAGRVSPWSSPVGHSTGVTLLHLYAQPLHLPAPLHSPGITRLPRYYEGSDSCPWTPPIHHGIVNALGKRAGLPAYLRWIFRPFRLQPPTAVPLVCSGFQPTGLPDRLVRRPARSPRRAVRLLGFALHSQARHDSRPNRVRLLRTGRSPPVAPHPASRRRSYLQLRSPEPTPARTCTLLIQRLHRRTSAASIACAPS